MAKKQWSVSYAVHSDEKESLEKKMNILLALMRRHASDETDSLVVSQTKGGEVIIHPNDTFGLRDFDIHSTSDLIVGIHPGKSYATIKINNLQYFLMYEKDAKIPSYL